MRRSDCRASQLDRIERPGELENENSMAIDKKLTPTNLQPSRICRLRPHREWGFIVLGTRAKLLENSFSGIHSRSKPRTQGLETASPCQGNAASSLRDLLYRPFGIGFNKNGGCESCSRTITKSCGTAYGHCWNLKIIGSSVGRLAMAESPSKGPRSSSRTS